MTTAAAQRPPSVNTAFLSRQGQPWTPEELELVRREYDRSWATAERLATQLHRTPTAIKSKAIALRVTRAHRTRLAWSKADIEFLEEHYQQRSCQWIGAHLPDRHRSKDAVRGMAALLRLQLAGREGWYTMGDVAGMLGVDNSWVRRYIQSGALVATEHYDGREGAPGTMGTRWHITTKDLRRFLSNPEHLGALTGRNVDLVALVDVLGVRR